MIPLLFLVFVLRVCSLQTAESAAARVCYLIQEPDPSKGNRLRWIQPFNDMCSCTSIRPGGLNTAAPYRKTTPIYTDQPIFTDDQEEIHDHYGCHEKLTDCQALLDVGYTEDGIYTIYPFQNDEGIQVLCDMRVYTGWIMVQRRYDGSVNFNRSWADYKDGFGLFDSEFWLGNEVLRKLTDGKGNWTIRMDLTNDHGLTEQFIKPFFHIVSHTYNLTIGNSTIEPTVDSSRFCGHPLGMEDRSIPDKRITASSRKNLDRRERNARLNYNACWASADDDNDSWLQVEIDDELVQIKGVITQGHPYKDYYVKHYQVQYSIDGNAWMYVMSDTSPQTPETFVGNTDGTTSVTNIFKYSIQARFIRIRPTGWKAYCCLRIELIGYTDDFLEMINKRPFSTYDKPNNNCPTLSGEEGWWFHDCCGGVLNNLNGGYIQPGDNSGINNNRVIRGSALKGTGVVKSEIKIRRKSP